MEAPHVLEKIILLQGSDVVLKFILCKALSVLSDRCSGSVKAECRLINTRPDKFGVREV